LRLFETERPSAFFCHNDWLALTVMLMLSNLGLRVPEDVSVLGVDHSPTLSRLAPNLTTLAYPFQSVEDAFVKQLDGSGEAESVLAGARFSVKKRKTVGPPPAN
jgi:DNA-binding LacI/PurR family transcriptional regulator